MEKGKILKLQKEKEKSGKIGKKQRIEHKDELQEQLQDKQERGIEENKEELQDM